MKLYERATLFWVTELGNKGLRGKAISVENVNFYDILVPIWDGYSHFGIV
jgi:hypothetical protein